VPLYEYRCPNCQRRFEVLQRVGAGAEGLECPDCGSRFVEKQYSTFAATATAGCAGGGGRFT
jgi:putative FmdB family regulatory protein